MILHLFKHTLAIAGSCALIIGMGVGLAAADSSSGSSGSSGGWHRQESGSGAGKKHPPKPRFKRKHANSPKSQGALSNKSQHKSWGSRKGSSAQRGKKGHRPSQHKPNSGSGSGQQGSSGTT